jgi:hypothetical protein
VASVRGARATPSCARMSSSWRRPWPQKAQGREAEPAGHIRRAGRPRLLERARTAVQPEVYRRDAGFLTNSSATGC